MGVERLLDSAHGRYEIVPELLVGVIGEDFVADKEVSDSGFVVEGEEIGADPFVGGGLGEGDVGD